MKRLLSFALVISSLSIVLAQDDDKLTSGPKVGAFIPGPFECLNINGPFGKGRPHCLVCEYGLNPVVMIFAKEPAEDKDGPLTNLMQKLDDIVGREDGKSFLGSFIVFLSPAAKSSANDPEVGKGADLVKEAKDRRDLIVRLSARAEKLKSAERAKDVKEGEEPVTVSGLVIACLPAPPKGYNLNPKADVTVIFYVKHKVQANFAFAEGQLTDERVDQIVKMVEAALKKPATDK